MKLKLAVVLAVLCLNAFADVHMNDGYELNCGKSFKMYTDAAGRLTGTVDLGSPVTVLCKRARASPYAPRVIYTCLEDRAGEGRLGVTVATGGGYGNKVKAVITQETMLPGRTQALKTVTCR